MNAGPHVTHPKKTLTGIDIVMEVFGIAALKHGFSLPCSRGMERIKSLNTKEDLARHVIDVLLYKEMKKFMSTHAEDLKFRLMTIELLRTAKRVPYTYRELSAKTGLPVTVLSRYAKGHVLPNAERAHQLWRTLTKLVGLQSELRRRIHFNSDGYFNNTEIIGDYNILRQAAHHALAVFAGKRVTKVLTAAVDGIPLGTMVANSLGVNLVVAKWNKEVGVPAFLEETYALKDSGVTMTLYVPKDALKRRDSILIVDDMIKTGETQAAMVNLVKKAKADIAGVYSIIAVGEEWQKKINVPKESVEVVTRINITQ